MGRFISDEVTVITTTPNAPPPKPRKEERRAHLIVLSGSLLAKSTTGLMDRALPTEDVSLVRNACQDVAGVLTIGHVWSRQVGSATWVDVSVGVGVGRATITSLQLVVSGMPPGVLDPGPSQRTIVLVTAESAKAVSQV